MKDSDTARANVAVRTWMMVALAEIGVVASLLLLWIVVLGASDARVIVPLAIARTIGTLAYVVVLFAPVRVFVRQREKGTVDDQTLLEVDAALQGMYGRLVTVQVVSWLVVLLLSLLPAAGVFYDRPLASAELLAAVMLIVSVVLAVPVILFNPLRMVLQPLQLEVSRAFLERGLDPGRKQTSIASHLVATSFFTVLVLILAGSAIAMLQRAQGIRAEALTEQRRLAELAAARPNLPVSEQVSFIDEAALPALLGAEAAAAGQTLTAFDPRTGRVFAAVALGEGRWVLAVDESDEQLGLTFGVILFYCLLSMIPTLLNSIATGRAVAGPIEELDAVAREVVESGQLGQISRIVPLRNDELGHLALTFNLMLDTFEELAVAAKAVASGDLRAEIDRPGDLPDAFRAMLEALQAIVSRVREATLELASAATELLVATDSQGAAAEQQAASVTQVRATTEQLAQSASQISAAASAVRQNAEQSVSTAATTAVKIEELDSQARGIRELLDLIREVADRSDLLALNGSLEAVRAGEAGRGFGLVAAEMRRLAERVAGAAEDINERIASIEASASNTVAATQQSRELAQSTAGAARDIDEAIVEQTARTNDAAAVVRQVVDAVSEFTLASAQTRSTAEGLREQADQLEHLVGHFKV